VQAFNVTHQVPMTPSSGEFIIIPASENKKEPLCVNNAFEGFIVCG
jgi:hypothetical protein